MRAASGGAATSQKACLATLSFLVLALILSPDCNQSNPAGPRLPAGQTTSSISATTTVLAGSTSSTTSTPSTTTTSVRANQPPTVSLSGGGSCYPRRTEPCTVTFHATANDPDGDRLTYSWSGCTSGSGAELASASCSVTAPSEFTATVTVDDGRGGLVRASAEARGVNNPPRVFFRFPEPLPPNSTSFGVGDVEDEEHCGTRDMSTGLQGACDRAFVECHSWGLDLELHTTGTGSCTLTVRFRDPWGATGAASATMRVAVQ